MTRRLLIPLALVAGVLTGAGASFGLRAEPAPLAGTPPVAAALPRVALEPSSPVLLAWTPGGLPDGLVAAARHHADLEAVTVVRAGMADLTETTDAQGATVDRAPAGLAFPLDAIAIDRSYASFVEAGARRTLERLRADEAVLSEASARLRRLGPGGRLRLAGGYDLIVVGVVDDTAIGGAELAVSIETGRRIGIAATRYLVAIHRGERTAFEDALRAALPTGVAVRFRAAGEAPYLRHGDAVLPPVFIKLAFGEFAYRSLDDETIAIDPAWQRENLVGVALPIVGRVRCHRALVAPLAGALAELERDNLAVFVDPGSFGGCWNPRRIARHEALSRHAWGAAVDLNVAKNPTGLTSVQDRRVVEVLQRWGFTWGGHWLIPDPAHFEWIGR